MGRSNARTPRKLYLSLVILGVVVGCSKDSRSKPAPWDDVGRPGDAVKANKGAAAALQAPALLAHVPADTPYVFAGFEPTPAGFWGAVCEQLCPMLESVLGVEPARLNGRNGAAVAAIFGAFKGKLNGPGLAELGFTPEPRWLIYGLGLRPVLRVEIADPGKVDATMGAIAAAAGLELEPRAIAAQTYRWGLITPTAAVAVGIVGKELVITWGDPLVLEQTVQRLFAGTKPTPSMGDGAALKKLAADYGFAGYGVGYVDVARVIELVSAGDSPSCAASRGQIAKVLPRVVFGYDRITARRLAATAVFETPHVDRVRGLRVDVPGFTTRIPRSSLAVAGVAVDRHGFEPIAKELVPWGVYYRLSCGALPFELPSTSGASDAASLLPPELVDEVVGGVVAVMTGNTAPAIPQSLAGYGVLGVGDAKRVMAGMSSLLAQGGLKDAAADGRFRTVDLGNLSTFVKTPARIQGQKGAIVFAAGEQARVTAEAGLAHQGTASRPLAMVGLDVGRAAKPLHRLVALPTSIDDGVLEPALMKDIHRAAQALIGFAVFTLGASDRGVELVARIDLN